MKKNVYISSHLLRVKYGKSVAKQLQERLPEFGYEVKSIEIEVKNEWCRDFMPVKTKSGRLVQFRYNPSYFADNDSRIPDLKKIHLQLGLICEQSNLILDGGAIEIFKNVGIVSDRVFRDNPVPEKKILSELIERLELEKLIIIPQHPYDFTGHVDGLVRFIDENHVLINDLTEEMEKSKTRNRYRHKLEEQWYYAFRGALYNADLKWDEFICTLHRNTKDKDASGIYLNFLLFDNHIVIPAFNNPETDNLVAQKLKNIYNKQPILIESKSLAEEGGIINCATWTY